MPGLIPSLIIARKRDGQALSREEIGAFVRGASDGSWADYQLSALLMAIYFRGMTTEETTVLTEAIMHSGAMADLSEVKGPKADKHSTGGVGDKVSLPLAPLVAACGVAVPMISGRGLGHTGGTLDKLESIPGFRVGLSLAEFRSQVKKVGAAFIGQTAELAPADRKLYALRDVTATVECIPLICASIMGKKMAEGLDALVLDVKFGSGAFLPHQAKARELAAAMIGIGRAMGKPVRALLTAMDQPLGRTVGNALEVAESIDFLKGRGPADLVEITFALADHMLVLAGAVKTLAEARRKLDAALASGAALAKFREIVVAQGGDASVIDDPSRLPRAPLRAPVKSAIGGWIQEVDARAVALAALRLGAGRIRTEDRVDPSVGIGDLVKVGEQVAPGAALCLIHAANTDTLAEAQAALGRAIRVGPNPPSTRPLIAEIMG